MVKLMIELPDTFGFVRAKQTFTVESKKLSSEIVAQLVMHGATQKIGDAAAGKDGAEALEAMQSVADALYEGDWGRSRGGAGEPAINRFIRAVVRAALGKESAAEYKALDAENRADWLWAKFEAQSAETQAKISAKAESEMEIARKAKADAAKLSGEFGL